MDDSMAESTNPGVQASARQLRRLGQLPESGQPPAIRRPLPSEYHTRLLNQQELYLHVERIWPGGLDGQLPLAACTHRGAMGSQWTLRTLRFSGQAYGCSQLHQPLIEFAGLLRIK